jgi:hypothetical protein
MFASVGAASADAGKQEGSLKGEELRKAVSGRTVYISTAIGIELPIRYSANGTMTSTSSANLAAMAGESVAKDSGSWWIAGDKLCQKWQNWLNGQTYCYEMRRSGRIVYWRRNDGHSGSARLGS